MARCSKYCAWCKERRRVELLLVPNGATYAFQARCTVCDQMIPPDGPPLTTAAEVAAWVEAQREVQP